MEDSLRALASRQLPPLLESAAAGVRDPALPEAARYYRDFVRASLEVGGQKGPGEDPLLPVLEEALAGETAAMGLGSGLAGQARPAAVDRAARAVDDGEESAGSKQADAEPEPAGIAWDFGELGAEVLQGGAGAAAGEAEPAAVQWDLGDQEPEAPEITQDAGAGVISWDIQLDDSSVGPGAESGAGSGGEAAGSGADAVLDSADALVQVGRASLRGREMVWGLYCTGLRESCQGAGSRLLWTGLTRGATPTHTCAHSNDSRRTSTSVQRLGCDEDYRARLADDLHELAAFLRQRGAELEVGTADPGPGFPPASAPEARRWLAATTSALAALARPELSRALQLRARPAFLRRQVAALDAKRAAGPRLERCVACGGGGWSLRKRHGNDPARGRNVSSPALADGSGIDGVLHVCCAHKTPPPPHPPPKKPQNTKTQKNPPPLPPNTRSTAREAMQRQAQLQRALVADAAALTETVAGVREAKALIQGALSDRLRRRVVVMGEVNALLQEHPAEGTTAGGTPGAASW